MNTQCFVDLNDSKESVGPVMEGGTETHNRQLKILDFSRKETKSGIFLCPSVEVCLDVSKSMSAVVCICVSSESVIVLKETPAANVSCLFLCVICLLAFKNFLPV